MEEREDLAQHEQHEFQKLFSMVKECCRRDPTRQYAQKGQRFLHFINPSSEHLRLILETQTQLKELSLQFTYQSDERIQIIKGLRKKDSIGDVLEFVSQLQSLSLDLDRKNLDNLEYSISVINAHYSRIIKMSFQRTLTRRGLELLRMIKNTTKVEFSKKDFTAEAVKSNEKVPETLLCLAQSLKWLHFNNIQIKDPSLMILAMNQLKQLRGLQITIIKTSVLATQILAFVKSNIQTLHLNKVPLTSKTFRTMLMNNPQVQILLVRECSIIDRHISVLSEVKLKLIVFDCSSSQITDKGVEIIVDHCCDLKELRLIQCHRISNKSLRTISRMQHLQALVLHQNWKLDNKGFVYLKTLKKLKFFDFGFNEFTANLFLQVIMNQKTQESVGATKGSIKTDGINLKRIKENTKQLKKKQKK